VYVAARYPKTVTANLLLKDLQDYADAELGRPLENGYFARDSSLVDVSTGGSLSHHIPGSNASTISR
jgi:hypothetical protein